VRVSREGAAVYGPRGEEDNGPSVRKALAGLVHSGDVLPCSRYRMLCNQHISAGRGVGYAKK
jgi:hypothetical protein